MPTLTPQALQRSLAPHLAFAIRQAKIDSGMSWRELGAEVGRSHAYLVQIAGGKRIPGKVTTERLIDALRLDPDTSAELLAVVPPRWWERGESGSHAVRDERVATNGVTDVGQRLGD